MGKGDETRGLILQRATELATTIGLEGLSIGMLAEELQLSKSGLFAHFRSKEALQLAVIERASERFTDVVIRPTLASPRGEPRVIAGFERWRTWPITAAYPGGCFFLAVAAEFDDRPGEVRDAIAHQMGAWLDVLSAVTRGAITEGHFHASVDPEQFVFEMFGILLSYHQQSRLLLRGDANERAQRAWSSLLARSRADEARPKTRARKAPPSSARAARSTRAASRSAS